MTNFPVGFLKVSKRFRACLWNKYFLPQLFSLLIFSPCNIHVAYISSIISIVNLQLQREWKKYTDAIMWLKRQACKVSPLPLRREAVMFHGASKYLRKTPRISKLRLLFASCWLPYRDLWKLLQRKPRERIKWLLHTWVISNTKFLSRRNWLIITLAIECRIWGEDRRRWGGYIHKSLVLK